MGTLGLGEALLPAYGIKFGSSKCGVGQDALGTGESQAGPRQFLRFAKHSFASRPSASFFKISKFFLPLTGSKYGGEPFDSLFAMVLGL